MFNCTLADYSIKINFFDEGGENEWYRKFLKYKMHMLNKEQYEHSYKPAIEIILSKGSNKSY
jgi:hypothetical protein